MANIDQWELHYHDVDFPGRAEFVRLLFEVTGTKYTFVGVTAEKKKAFAAGQIEGYPVFAPPMIKHNDLQLSQTPVICKYIGKQLGLYPDNEQDQWHAEQLNNTIHDYIAEGRLAFHGKNHCASYYIQIEETQPYIKEFVTNRMSTFLLHFERALCHNQGGNGYVIGDKLTYVDLGLLHVLRATESQFPDAWKQLDSVPLLKAFKLRISALPKLAEYFKSDRCRSFSDNSMM